MQRKTKGTNKSQQIHILTLLHLRRPISASCILLHLLNRNPFSVTPNASVLAMASRGGSAQCKLDNMLSHAQISPLTRSCLRVGHKSQELLCAAKGRSSRFSCGPTPRAEATFLSSFPCCHSFLFFMFQNLFRCLMPNIRVSQLALV